MALTIVEAEWPGGVVCMDCGDPLDDGDAYSERLTDAGPDAEFVVEIVCIRCAFP